MTKIDQFESVFKAAAKDTYAHQDVHVRKALLALLLDRAGEVLK